MSTLRTRWLGRLAYSEAYDLQRGLLAEASDDVVLLLEHPHTYTLGVNADRANVLVDPASVGAEMVQTDRGGDVTYHGPGQLVGYPILTLPGRRGGGMADTVGYVRSVEQLLIDALSDLGVIEIGRLDRHPGLWIEPDSSTPRKVAAVGVRLSRARSMHGFAVNVDPDLSMFDHIVPCGIREFGVTSLRAEGYQFDMRGVVEAVARRAADRWGTDSGDFSAVVWRRDRTDEDLSAFSRGHGPGDLVKYSASGTQRDGTSLRLAGRLAEAGVAEGHALVEPKPEWMRARVRLGDDALAIKKTVRDLDLVTVCEEAGCPNLSECWSEGTATFMVCGERCTRACGFCLVDTQKPRDVDPAEPASVAEAVERMGLDYVVLTMVARDDLTDGGAAHVAATIDAIRARVPGAKVEALISDLRGDARSLEIVLESRLDVLNHNVETVSRLQRAVRPSAGYGRSLTVLARAKAAGSITKSGVIVGMGETFDEVCSTLADLAAVGVDIVTIGQYLRPTSHHLPVVDWWPPETFDKWRDVGVELGIGHVEASPFTRSSHHAAESFRRVSDTVRA